MYGRGRLSSAPESLSERLGVEPSALSLIPDHVEVNGTEDHAAFRTYWNE